MNSSFITHPNLIGASVTGDDFGGREWDSPQKIVAVSLESEGLVIYTCMADGTIWRRSFVGCTVVFN